MTQKLIATYRIINLLSIDVALGAICSALFFARLLGVNILPYGLISLGLTVWIIYTVDHLMDARRINAQAATARHQFHQQHFNTLFVVVLITMAANAVIIFFIRKPVLISGVIVALLVGVYLVVHRYLNFLKEVFIALFYTIGVLLPSIAVTSVDYSEWPWIVIVQFFITALINLILFSWFDYEKDLLDGHRSFVTVLGVAASKVFIGILFVSILILTVIADTSGMSSIVILVMNSVLLTVSVFHQYFAINDRFRLAGDVVFFVPLLYLLK